MLGDTCSPNLFLQGILRSKRPAHKALAQPFGLLPAPVSEVLQEIIPVGAPESPRDATGAR